MNILLLGSGGREHALAHKLAASHNVHLFAAPANPGILRHAMLANINVTQHEEVVKFCIASDIALVIIGPEALLASGLTDTLREHGINVFGPSRAAARIESSKAFAKDFMMRHGIPTAQYRTFSDHEHKQAREYVAQHALPIVIKADGLAAGKGVTVAKNHADALEALDAAFDGKFGKAGKSIVVEEFMYGEEASIFAISDGERFLTLAPAQDHKRIGDGDTGANTGGMGAYCPAPIITPTVLHCVEKQIIEPTLRGMKAEGYPFIGCLYAGLMIDTEDNPKVVEFNARFGDPETQAVLAVLEADFAQLLYSAATGKLDTSCVTFTARGAACCVVLAASGYPGEVRTGDEITGIEDAERFGNGTVTVFHAGTALHNNLDGTQSLRTNGGRVLGVTAHTHTLPEAITLAYQALKHIHFRGKTYRTDIGYKALQRYSLNTSKAL
ncbi:MAG: phosphoribosylamine--glycine ligase [Bacteroidota bacterium]|nr:phosphoribosylamine--glycine ligase [Candidatus Kapabacteria bacterium]MDW8220749.1 phosphoribosylamine--glycine ligase [Bacteroidota bacterium]